MCFTYNETKIHVYTPARVTRRYNDVNVSLIDVVTANCSRAACQPISCMCSRTIAHRMCR